MFKKASMQGLLRQLARCKMFLWMIVVTYYMLATISSTSQKVVAYKRLYRNVTTTIGASVTLRCHVPSSRGHISWFYKRTSVTYLKPYRRASNINLQRDRHIESLRGDEVLKIVNPHHKDAGFYVLKRGVEEMCVFYLNVLIPPKAKCINGSSVAVQEGTTISLQCSGYGNPPPVVRWYRTNNDNSIEDDSLVLGNVMLFHDVTRYASGQYVCVATNDLSQTDRCRVDVQVEFLPDIEVMEETLSVLTSPGNAIMACRVTANPMPEVIWTKGDNLHKIKQGVNFQIWEDTEMVKSHYTKFVMLSLNVSQLNTDIGGKYWCRLAGYGNPYRKYVTVHDSPLDARNTCCDN